MVNLINLFLLILILYIEKFKQKESMKFGTLEYDLKACSSHSSFIKHKFNKKNEFKRLVIKNETIETKEDENNKQLVCYPKLPDGWVRNTNTGDLSYDLTVNEISNKLKRTQVNFNVYILIS